MHLPYCSIPRICDIFSRQFEHPRSSVLVSISNNPSPQGASRLAAHCRNLSNPRRAVLALLPSPACPGAAFFRSKPLPLLLLLGMLIAMTLAGCSDDPAPKSAPEGTVPTNTPTPTPTPTTDTSGQAPGGGVPRFEISAETTVQQAFNTFTAQEQNCIRDSIDSDTLDALLTESFLEEDSTFTDEQQIKFFSCLNEETAEALWFALIVASGEAEGVTVSEASITCMQELLQDVNIVALMASGDDSPEAERFFTLVELCLARPAAYFRTPPQGAFRIPFERLESDSAWQVVFDEFNASEQMCIRNELGEELLASELDRPSGDVLGEVLLGDTESVWGESVLECLDPVTAVSLIHSFQVALAIALGGAESSDEVDQMNACLWRLLSEGDVALLAAGQVYEGYEAGAERCLETTEKPRNATLINVGDTVEGTIDFEGDQDLFRFTATAGQFYQIDVALGTLDGSSVVLLDADGRTVKDDYGNSTASRIIWEAGSGDYFIQVSASWDSDTDAGDYTLTLALSDITDDYGNNESDAAAVTVGPAVQGSIDYSGDVDVFSFRAEEGKFYQIDAALGTLEYAELRLLDSRGGFLASDYDYDYGDTRASRIIWEAQGAGDYYVVVQGDFSNTGTYILTIGLSGITDDHGNSESDATAVTVGAAVQGSIDYAGDADYFSFRAEEGGLYQIDAALGTLEDENSELSLLDSGGMILTIDHSFENFLDPRIAWEAPSAGDYYVVMKKGVGSGTGTYTLTITAADR